MKKNVRENLNNLQENNPARVFFLTKTGGCRPSILLKRDSTNRYQRYKKENENK